MIPSGDVPVTHKKTKKKHRRNPVSAVPDSPPGTVTFTPSDGPSVTVLLHDVTPILTDGYAQWEVIDRPRRPGLTRFKGRNPFKQDIAIMFDGWMSSEPQESNISALLRMSQQASVLAEPPKIYLSGQALKKELIWVIDSIDWDTDNALWEISGSTPVRMRQSATVHLLEYVDDAIIVTSASPAIVNKGKGNGKKIPAGGMTLQQISQQEYGTPDGWSVILAQNPWLLGVTKRTPIAVGKTVMIPQWHGHHATEYVVGKGDGG